MKKIVYQLLGLGVCGSAFLLLASLVSYHSGDPSLNRAASSTVENWIGTPGAIVSDVVLQVLGFGAALLVCALMAWGWRLIVMQRLGYFWLRSCALLIGLVTFSLFLSYVPTPESWPVVSGLGGAMGWLLQQKMGSVLPGWSVAACAAILCLLAAPLALGLNKQEWHKIYRFMMLPLRYVAMVARLVRDAIVGEVQQVHEKASVGRSKKMVEQVGAFQNMFKKEHEKQSDNTKLTPNSPTKSPVKSVEKSQVSRSSKTTRKQTSMELRGKGGDYEIPPLSLLKEPSIKGKKKEVSDSSLKQNAKMLGTVLEDFGIKGEITHIRPGPVATLYELEPAAGTKSARVIGLADDIARSMSAISARIAVIPGRNAIGIELPNHTRDTVYLRELFEEEEYSKTKCSLPLALGKDIGGEPIIEDLARMPHLLVAGTTGSGKSVAINTMIMSLVYHLTPEQCKFIMIDPKMLELSVYDGIPHLLTPVVTEPGKAVVALKWTVKEMENRYRLMANLGVRNIDNYNKRMREAKRTGEVITREVQTGFDPDTGKPTYETQEMETEPLPFIVVIVDEMADLMLVSGKEIEGSIQRLAQMARAAGIHLIMATQRPSVDVITGVIKANFPTRISFQVTSKIDSRTILGEQGAEQLLGMGDMLHMAGGGRITRVHGPFVSDREVEEIVVHLKKQGEPNYIESVTVDEDSDAMGFADEDESDADRALYDQAVAIVTRDRKASTSYVQRCLKIGYNRAARIIDKMEREGVVGPANHVGKREVLARDTEDA